MDLKSRILSVDVFRGLTICFMIMVNNPGSWEHIYAPMSHSPWHGWTPTDLVFPFFLTTVGISMALSMSNIVGDQSKRTIKVVKRALLIFLVGLLLNWFPFFGKSLDGLRIWGVLQRIAASYLVAGLAVIYLKSWKNLLGYAVVALLGYWAILYFGGDYTLEGNVNNIVDKAILSDKHLYKGYGIPFDPEGILGTISGSAHVIIGYLLANKLLAKPINVENTIKWTLISGIGLVILSLLWNLVFPINKPIWTSSYVCFASGMAFLLYTLLFWLIDAKGYTKWAFPFRVFGLNPLTAFALSGIMARVFGSMIKIDGKGIHSHIYDFFSNILGPLNGSLFYAIFFTFLIWLVALIMYQRKIVIKL